MVREMEDWPGEEGDEFMDYYSQFRPRNNRYEYTVPKLYYCLHFTMLWIKIDWTWVRIQNVDPLWIRIQVRIRILVMLLILRRNKNKFILNENNLKKNLF